jgi:hypothetical protein
MLSSTASRALANKVSDLVRDAVRVRVLPDRLKLFINENGEVIFNVMRNWVRMIRFRPHDLSEGQVTIFDKALLAITRGGTDLQSVAAVHFYATHYLGFDEETEEVSAAMKDAAKLGGSEVMLGGKCLIFGGCFHVMYWLVLTLACNISDREPKTDDTLVDDQLTTVASNSRSLSIDVSQLRTRYDAGLQRLIDTYDTSCKEFFEAEDRGEEKAGSAARYLRDTAENLLTYLRETNIDPEKLREVENMRDTAKAAAEQLKGGRVRKFDNEYASRLQESQNQSKYRRGSEGERGGAPPGFAGCSIPWYSYSRRSRSPHGHHRRDAPWRDDEYGRTDERRDNREGQKRTSTGRGHSGIPYGYGTNRLVDSWKPGDD